MRALLAAMHHRVMTNNTWNWKNLRRDRANGWLGGVVAGLAHSVDMSPNALRLVLALSLLIPGPQLVFYAIGYVVGMAFMPEAGSDGAATPPAPPRL